MRLLTMLVSEIAKTLALDVSVAEERIRLRVHALLTLAITVLAVCLGAGYQLLRHLPQAWRDWLLGDDALEQ